jgi:glycine/D-amino acid oxidase-like deaminating enzyme
MADAECDVCVIGLGCSGLTALIALREQGLSCIGIDKETVGAGAAGNNGGFLLAGVDECYHLDCARNGRS